MHWGLQETQWGFGTQGLQCTTSSRASREQRAQEKGQQCPAGLAGPRGARGGAQQQRPGMEVPTSLPVGRAPERRLSHARTLPPSKLMFCSGLGFCMHRWEQEPTKHSSESPHFFSTAAL